MGEGLGGERPLLADSGPWAKLGRVGNANVRFRPKADV